MGRASEQSVCVYEAVSVEQGLRHLLLPASIACEVAAAFRLPSYRKESLTFLIVDFTTEKVHLPTAGVEFSQAVESVATRPMAFRCQDEGAVRAGRKFGGMRRELIRCRGAAARGWGMLVAAAVAAELMRGAAGARGEGEGLCTGGVHVSILRPMSGEYVEDDAPVGARVALCRWPETEHQGQCCSYLLYCFL